MDRNLRYSEAHGVETVLIVGASLWMILQVKQIKRLTEEDLASRRDRDAK